ncbi:MAG: hypothetical protein KZQ92_09480 [Candidatus Thiodiazotropha sp. (ex Lucinoma borealis)]|nr:hypothetical protein [Candidatus Thiodiazotropha sp. (ex Lucinoma borealis)]
MGDYDFVAIAALSVSIISLIISLRTTHVNRRVLQFQKLAKLRTKNTKLRWKMRNRLYDLQDCVRSLSEINHPDAIKWSEIVVSLQSSLRKTEEDDLHLKDLYSTLEKYSILISYGTLDDMHHNIDSITESVDVSRNELLEKMKGYVEELKMLALESE